MATLPNTLKAIREAQENGELRSFGPIRVFVVNIIARVEFPFKFVYQGCMKLVDNGRM